MNKFTHRFILSLFVIFFSLLFGSQEEELAYVDLEENVQDFVVSTKQIVIPEAPYAFNPSIVRWRGRLLMSYRQIFEFGQVSQLSSSANSYIGLVWLDEEFNPVASPQILSLTSPDFPESIMCSEDARLLVSNQRLYLIYSANGTPLLNDEGFRMYVSELYFDGDIFHVIQNECLSDFEGKSKNKREKNWVPFNYNDHLLFSYGLSPHKIFRPLLNGSQSCETVSTTFPSIAWEWGELRGGTPALPLNDEVNLAFFHSSIYTATVHSEGQCLYHYFMGAYTFNRNPPFEIRQVSPEPVVGKNFYHGPIYVPYWHPVRVIFPGGFCMDDEFIWIVYGRQDHESWVVQLNKKALIDSLIRVSPLQVIP